MEAAEKTYCDNLPLMMLKEKNQTAKAELEDRQKTRQLGMEAV